MLIKRRKSIQSTTRIGELLNDAGIVTNELIEQSLPIAKKSKLPLGRVLIMSGYLSESDVDCALHMQKCLREGTTNFETARRILKVAHCNQTTVEEALALLRWEDAYTKPISNLGKLLLAAEILHEQIAVEMTARATSYGIPLGRMLMNIEIVQEPTIINALNTQVLIRDRKLTRMEAIRALKTAHQNRVSLPTAIEMCGLESALQPENARMPLGELLQAAGFVSHYETLDAVEQSLENQRKLGEILIEYYSVPALVLEAALQLQNMIADRTISPRRAAELLGLVSTVEAPLEQILFEMERIKQVIAFLREAGLLSEDQIRQSACSAYEFEERQAQILLENGVVTPDLLRIGAICLVLFQKARLSRNQAALVARHCLANNVEPEEALETMSFEDEESLYSPEELLGKTA